MAALKQDGILLLEQLLNDPELPVPGQALQAGEQNYGPRQHTVLTLLGWMSLSRPYAYHETEKRGRFAVDEALGLRQSYSPTVAQWMCRAGACSRGFEAASQDLLAYAGWEVPGRQIQRMVRIMAPILAQQRTALPPPTQPKAVDVLCVSVDGTGVPVRPEEVVDRPGKQPDGSARTREVKLGSVFTHALPKPGERPSRDRDSTSYLADIIEAVDFGGQVRREAFRRGLAAALLVVFLGDGAKWVWELARVNFPMAICILDFFHAVEHLSTLIHLLYGPATTGRSQQTFRRWRQALRQNRIGWVIRLAQRDLPLDPPARELAQKEIDYFQNNQSRMQYKTYLEKGYFIGSGVVEAGCKSVVGYRLKQSGMRWGVEGARNVLTIRCLIASGLFDQLWEQCHPTHFRNSVDPANLSKLCLN